MFIVVKSRKVLLICAAVLVVIMLFLAAAGENGVAAVFSGTAGIRKMPINRVETMEPVVALTFDADIGEDKTEKILEILKENNVPATFFLAGFWAEKYPELVKKMDGQGIETGSHGDTHANMTKLSSEKQKEEIMTSSQKITSLTGKEIKFFRPPMGEYNDNLISASNTLGMKCIRWDVDSGDWEGKSATLIVSRVMTKVKNGSIVLFHTSGENTEKALPIVITALKNKGYRFSTVGDLVYQENYYIDLLGVQKRK